MLGDNRLQSKDSTYFGPIKDAASSAARSYDLAARPARVHRAVVRAPAPRRHRARDPGLRREQPVDPSPQARPLRRRGARGPDSRASAEIRRPLGDGRDHPVDVVAVHAVEVHRERGAEVAHLLHVPAERGTPKRWNSATSPAIQSVWCMFIASMPSRARSAAWRSRGVRIVVRRRECTSRDVGVAPRSDRSRPSVGVQIHSRSRGAGRARATSIRASGRRPGSFTSIESSKSVPHARVDVGEARDVEGRELRGGRCSAPRTRRRPRPTIRVVDEDDLAVGREPGVGLSRPRRPALERPWEGRDRVLRLLEPGAPVSERDRRHRPSCLKPHAP